MLLINSFGAGGAERSTYDIARYLIDRGESVVLVALKHRAVGIEAEIAALDVPLFINTTSGRWAKTQFIRRVIEQTQPDIVHSVIFEANLLLRLTRLFTRHRFVMVQSIVSTPYVAHRKILGGLVGRIKFALATLADAVSARLSKAHFHGISQVVLDHYRPYYGYRPEQTSLVYRGRAPVARPTPPVREMASPTPAPCILLNVGRQVPEKGQRLIVEAMHLLRKRGRLGHTQLHIYGREGNATEALKRAIRTAELTDAVQLKGFVPDLEAVYLSADVFVFPSYYEGMGGALVEAMSAQLPAVCSDLPIFHEILGPQPGALFFPMGDAERLADCLDRVINDASLRKCLAQRSYDRFAGNFTNEQSLNGIYDMYHRLLP